MELVIYNPKENGFLQKIDWNFKDLKTEITTKIEEYKGLVYTDEQIKEAKADRAKLNKLIDALEGKRKEIKRQVMIPYIEFEKQEKELVTIINAAVTGIDGQVKAYEERQRAEKKEKVQKIYEECIGDLDRILSFEKVFKPQYVNASTTLKSIKEEIQAFITKVDQDLKAINADTGKYVFEMKEAYLKNYDMAEALQAKQRAEEAQQRRIAYEEERKKREEARKLEQERRAQEIMNAGVSSSEQKRPEVTKIETPISIVEQREEKKEVLEAKQITIDFRVTATAKQFELLKGFLNQNNITYGPVPEREEK